MCLTSSLYYDVVSDVAELQTAFAVRVLAGEPEREVVVRGPFESNLLFLYLAYVTYGSLPYRLLEACVRYNSKLKNSPNIFIILICRHTVPTS
jgi:hypothetical protein